VKPRWELLAAYVVSSGNTDEKTLSEHLRGTLPKHIVGVVFVFLDAMHLTPNGKVDRKALPPDRNPRNADFVGPRDALEAMLATIWMDVLGLERVGVHDDFFASLLTSFATPAIVDRSRSFASGTSISSDFRIRDATFSARRE
jgi:hypothetical protein